MVIHISLQQLAIQNGVQLNSMGVQQIKHIVYPPARAIVIAQGIHPSVCLSRWMAVFFVQAIIL